MRGRPRKSLTASQLKQLAKRGQKSYYPKPLSVVDINSAQLPATDRAMDRVRTTRSQTKRQNGTLVSNLILVLMSVLISII